ncbi:MAG: ATP-dependent DNA ligase [Candidatus Aenigmarchaeota archaeon]|nr:ATP-dependent DNA ligase [Candidatus Aenigmarchaeota archaeon]
MEYARLVDTYELLGRTSGRLKKVGAIASLLEDTPAPLLQRVVLLLQGTVFPAWSDREIGIANQLMIKAIALATGFSEQDVVARFTASGDLGKVIDDLTSRKRQRTLASRRLTVEKVVENLQAVAAVEGKGAVDRKLSLVTELLSFATPAEAKYIVRTTLGTLRVGVAEGVIRDAIARAFFADVVWGPRAAAVEAEGLRIIAEDGMALDRRLRERNRVVTRPAGEIGKLDLWKPAGKTDLVIVKDDTLGARLKAAVTDAIEMAWYLRSDYGEIARIAKERGLRGLESIGLEPGKPYHVLLSEKAPSLEAALAAYPNAALEWKYDGARLSIHKQGDRVWLFTRRLEDVTAQFPEVAAWTKQAIAAKEAIVEGEMLGFRQGKPMPFQFLSQRIKRKYDIEQIAKEIPVQVNLFDIVSLDGASLFRMPQRERWALLQRVVKPIPGKLQFARHLETTDAQQAAAFYREALAAAQEGLMVKNQDAAYQPGRRVGYWLKVKPTMENLDLAIIGGVWGTGKRTGWFGSLVLGCRDGETFRECGMIGTGIKEKGKGVTFEELTALLKPLVTAERGNQVTIRPHVVVEVGYEEIQRSPTYSSGFALRFPRVVRLRPDKGPQEADDLERVRRLYSLQARQASPAGIATKGPHV